MSDAQGKVCVWMLCGKCGLGESPIGGRVAVRGCRWDGPEGWACGDEAKRRLWDVAGFAAAGASARSLSSGGETAGL